MSIFKNVIELCEDVNAQRKVQRIVSAFIDLQKAGLKATPSFYIGMVNDLAWASKADSISLFKKMYRQRQIDCLREMKPEILRWYRELDISNWDIRMMAQKFGLEYIEV